jgi:hypothetical protein
MKFNKNKSAKVSAPANVVGQANQNLLNKVNRKSPATKSVSTPAPDAEYRAPKHDTRNNQGMKAYTKDSFTHLLALLNTLKLDGDQFYRSESKAMQDVKAAVEDCARQDIYFTAQCIRWSRTNGEGLRSVTQLASAYLAAYLSGADFAKYFYARYNKATKIGGVVFRLDDAVQIANVYFGITKANSLPNSLRKGFVSVLENADSYELAKYKNSGIVDLINLVHPNANNSKATVEVDGAKYRAILTAKGKATKSKVALYQNKLAEAKGDKVSIKTLDALMLGVPFAADTHETRNSQAGEIVSAAKKSGKITEREAVELMQEAVSSNFKELLQTGKLGMLATVRNLVRMVQNKVDSETVKLVVDMLTNGEAIRKSLIHPMQLDIAYEMLRAECGSDAIGRQFQVALQKGFELAIPNLQLSGDTCVMVDVSGSMTSGKIFAEGSTYKKANSYSVTPAKKSFLIAAVLAKATNADVILFDTSARAISYNPTLSVFDLADQIERAAGGYGGGTTISTAFNLITKNKKVYNQIVLLSDNAANGGNTAKAAGQYFSEIAKCFVYSVDLQSYGTTQLRGENVFEMFGYGFAMFEDMQKRQFNPNAHLDEVRKVRFIDKNR